MCAAITGLFCPQFCSLWFLLGCPQCLQLLHPKDLQVRLTFPLQILPFEVQGLVIWTWSDYRFILTWWFILRFYSCLFSLSVVSFCPELETLNLSKHYCKVNEMHQAGVRQQLLLRVMPLLFSCSGPVPERLKRPVIPPPPFPLFCVRQDTCEGGWSCWPTSHRIYFCTSARKQR